MFVTPVPGDAPNRIKRCWLPHGVAEEAPVLERAAPSRVSLIDPRLRSMRHTTDDALMRLTRLAALGQRPRFPNWSRRPSVLRERFGHLTVPLPPTQQLMSAWTPDSERWGGVQEASLASAGCPCDWPSPGEIAGLMIEKDLVDPNLLHLFWSPSCLPDVTDYSVHEGEIGTWYDHAAERCSTGGLPSADHTPGPGNRYLLIVPLNDDAEGGYGRNSSGAERPSSRSACRVRGRIESCP